MTERLEIQKTYKLYIAGKFPRTESGRSLAIKASDGSVIAHTCQASRKDLRNAVEAAAAAANNWASATGYLRGQIIYRLAEMLEGKRDELARELRHASAHREVAHSIDRLVHYAGWTDKLGVVLGSANPVAGPYHNFSIPEPTGVVGIVCPDQAPLLALVSLLAPVLASGCTSVVLASETNPIPAMVLAEAIATSDLPAGVVNLLSGTRQELVPHFASHRGIQALHAGGLEPEHATALRAGAAENLKRVVIRDPFDPDDAETCESPWWVEPFLETKTIWHPSAV